MREKLVDIISALYIFLFVYAAISKLTDYEKFVVQIGQSPMLTDMAGFIAWFIPSIELLTAALLVFGRTRLVGLFGAFSLMTMFTAYIITVTSFSDYIPCACGGVLENLSWKQHLIFNIGFMVMAITAVLTHHSMKITIR